MRMLCEYCARYYNTPTVMSKLAENDKVTEMAPKPSETIVSNIIGPRLNKYSNDHKCSSKAAAERLAQHLGVHLINVTRWQRNNTQPSLAQAIEIAKFFGLPVEQVFTTHKL